MVISFKKITKYFLSSPLAFFRTIRLVGRRKGFKPRRERMKNHAKRDGKTNRRKKPLVKLAPLALWWTQISFLMREKLGGKTLRKTRPVSQGGQRYCYSNEKEREMRLLLFSTVMALVFLHSLASCDHALGMQKMNPSLHISSHHRDLSATVKASKQGG